MYPELADLRRLERDTLLRVTQIGEFARLGNIQALAQLGHKTINPDRGGVDVNLSFNLDIRLPADRKKKGLFSRRVEVGALIQQADDKKSVRNASYSLIICRYADPKKNSTVVRKLHFDYEPVVFRNAREPKPSVHMQVCGKLSPYHVSQGYSATKLSALYPGFEKPRIPLPPTSLALLLNWLLVEFQSDSAAQSILSNPAWRKLVADAERIVLRPYFDTASGFLKGAGNSGRRFLQSHLYGMTCDM